MSWFRRKRLSSADVSEGMRYLIHKELTDKRMTELIAELSSRRADVRDGGVDTEVTTLLMFLQVQAVAAAFGDRARFLNSAVDQFHGRFHATLVDGFGHHHAELVGAQVHKRYEQYLPLFSDDMERMKAMKAKGDAGIPLSRLTAQFLKNAMGRDTVEMLGRCGIIDVGILFGTWFVATRDGWAKLHATSTIVD